MFLTSLSVQAFPAYSIVCKYGLVALRHESVAPSRVGSCTDKYKTRLERLVRNKHSSLLGTLVNYDHKKFYNIGPWTKKLFTAVINAVPL